MKFVLISPKNRTAWNFRGDLIRDIVNLGHEVIVTGPNDIDVDKIQALGARFIKIPMEKTGVNAAEDLRYINALRKLFKKEKPDITFGYTIKPVIYGAIAARLAKVPHRYSMIAGAGYVFVAKTTKAKIIRMIVKILYRIGFSCAQKVIFMNPDDKNDFVSLKLLKESKCRMVNGSGVNMERFEKTELPEKPVFFMLSRALRCKGVSEYLEAAQIVHDKHPDVRIMYLGEIDESMQDSLKKEEVQKYIDSGAIEYYPEHPDVRIYYRQCSVFVLPSHREGIPRTVQEAMAMGRAVIVTDAPGCRETVIDGKTGFMVPVGNPQTLADTMCKFIENPELIRTMGEESYKYCQKKFDVRKVNRTLLAHLDIQKLEE
ncbi:MAG: glycosyltransferase family 4 protein [Ruminococcaceae bacterium]|nr:glycosyltransferase family 4 protein [Oscillospiraceae bacterium]